MKKLSFVLLSIIMSLVLFGATVEAETVVTTGEEPLDHLRENYLTLDEVHEIQVDGENYEVLGLEDEKVFTVVDYIVKTEENELKFPIFLLGSNEELMESESIKFMYGQTPIFTKDGVLNIEKKEVEKINEEGKLYINYELVQAKDLEIVKAKSDHGNYMAKFELGSQNYEIPVNVSGGANPVLIGLGAVILGAVAALVVKKARG